MMFSLFARQSTLSGIKSRVRHFQSAWHVWLFVYCSMLMHALSWIESLVTDSIWFLSSASFPFVSRNNKILMTVKSIYTSFMCTVNSSYDLIVVASDPFWLLTLFKNNLPTYLVSNLQADVYRSCGIIMNFSTAHCWALAARFQFLDCVERLKYSLDRRSARLKADTYI
jgi:hypothetical protein